MATNSTNPTTSSKRRLGTQQQAAALMQVSTRTVRTRISEGIITGYRLPGSRAIRVDLNEIERLMQTVPAMKPKQPFGPKARIVNVVTAEPDADRGTD